MLRDLFKKIIVQNRIQPPVVNEPIKAETPREKRLRQDKELWTGWNYNVGHDEYVQDRYNTNMIIHMSRLAKVKEHDITMVYDPLRDGVKKSDNSYMIKSGTFNIFQTNEWNWCTNLQNFIVFETDFDIFKRFRNMLKNTRRNVANGVRNSASNTTS